MEDELEGRRLVAHADQLSAAGRYEEAIGLYQQAIARAPIALSGYRFVVGELLFELQRYEDAARTFDAIVRATPHHPQAWDALGRTWALLGHAEGAAQAFERAIALAPSWADPLYHAALAYSDLGDRARCEERLRRAIAIEPRYAEVAREDGLA